MKEAERKRLSERPTKGSDTRKPRRKERQSKPTPSSLGLWSETGENVLGEVQGRIPVHLPIQNEEQCNG
jgi:hypothetical protein